MLQKLVFSPQVFNNHMKLQEVIFWFRIQCVNDTELYIVLPYHMRHALSILIHCLVAGRFEETGSQCGVVLISTATSRWIGGSHSPEAFALL